jgi:uncharacterized delta-60 repeat protein
MAVGSGNAVVASASGNLILLRYLEDGSLDPDFSDDGMVEVSSDGYLVADVLFESDGAILLMGSAALERYLPSGVLDPTFGNQGRVQLKGVFLRGMALQPDGKIILVGEVSPVRDVAILRLDASGTLDPTFDGDGIATVDLGTVNDFGWRAAVLPTGTILVLASRQLCDEEFFCRTKGVLIRLQPDGSQDATYGEAGQARWRFRGLDPIDIALDSHGRAVVLMDQFGSWGCPSGAYGLIRFRPSGAVAERFGHEGRVWPGAPIESTGLALQADGRILISGSYCVGGSQPDFAVVRTLRSGRLDPAFGNNGLSAPRLGSFDSRATAIGIQADGNIVLAGGSMVDFSDLDIVVARYLAA